MQVGFKPMQFVSSRCSLFLGRCNLFCVGAIAIEPAQLSQDLRYSPTHCTIILRSGRIFPHAPKESTMAVAENHIYVEPGTNLVYGRYRIDHCGFDNPTRCQLFTIPIVRVELYSHGKEMIGILAPNAHKSGGGS